MALNQNLPKNPTSGDDWTKLFLGQQNNPANTNALFAAGGLDPNGRYEGYNAAKYMMPGEYNYEAHQLGLGLELQPQEQAAIRSTMNMLQHPELMSQQYRNQAMGQAQQAMPELTNHILSSGAGLGAQQGAMVSQLNQGAQAANQFDANLMSPTGLEQRAQGIAALAQSAMPNYQGIGALHSIETGTPRNASGLDVLGNLAGDFISGGGLSNLFKGGGGGG